MRVYQFRHVGSGKCCFPKKTGIIEKNFPKSIRLQRFAGLACRYANGE